jgi:hypothetical protein
MENTDIVPYKVVRVYKRSRKRVDVEVNLTRAEAQRIVQKDIDKGYSTNVSMLVFTKQ